MADLPDQPRHRAATGSDGIRLPDSRYPTHPPPPPLPPKVAEHADWYREWAARAVGPLLDPLFARALAAQPGESHFYARLFTDRSTVPMCEYVRSGADPREESDSFPYRVRRPGERVAVLIHLRTLDEPLFGFAGEPLPAHEPALRDFARERERVWRELRAAVNGLLPIPPGRELFDLAGLDKRLIFEEEFDVLVCAGPRHLKSFGLSGGSSVHQAPNTALLLPEAQSYWTLADRVLAAAREYGGELILQVAFVPANWQSRYVERERQQQARSGLRQFIEERLGNPGDLRPSDAFSGFPGVRREFGEELKERLEERVSRVTQLLNQAGPKERRAFVAALREELNSLNLRVVCPACEQPAILRFGRTGTAKDGAFFFEHSTGGRKTSHGVTTAVPTITFVSKPPDKRMK